MPLWKLLKMAREVLATWRGLPAEQREQIHVEADRVRGLVGELARTAGSLGKRRSDPSAPAQDEVRLDADLAAARTDAVNPLEETRESTPARDIKEISRELLDAATILGVATSPAALETAKQRSPRSLRLASKAGSFGAEKIKKRWG